MQAGDPAPPKAAPAATTTTVTSTSSSGLGVGVYAFVLLGAVAAFGAYQYLQKK